MGAFVSASPPPPLPPLLDGTASLVCYQVFHPLFLFTCWSATNINILPVGLFLFFFFLPPRRPGLKDTGGALYIRAAMQFIRLPLKTDPMEVLKSSIDLTKVICKVPGVVRYGPL